MLRNDEPTFNQALAEVLRKRNPRWKDIGKLLGAEQLDVFREGGRPDIFVDDPDGAPIIIETEYAPARTVELDAQSRLNKTTNETGKTIEQAIALRAPDSLRNVSQSELAAAVRTTTFEYCLYSISALSQENDRWPTSGWLKGNVNDLAQLIETASVSERAVAANLETLEHGIVASAGRPSASHSRSASGSAEDCGLPSPRRERADLADGDGDCGQRDHLPTRS